MAANSNVRSASPESKSGRPSLLRWIARRIRRRPDQALEAIAIIEASQLFDKAWYLRQYPDVVDSGMDPIQHYVRHGAAEGRDPSGTFSTLAYLEQNPDVAASGANPFRHFVEHGLKEGRPYRRVTGGGAAVVAADTIGRASAEPASKRQFAHSDADVLARSGIFERSFYLAANPGAVPAGVEPVQHYLQIGAADGWKPCALFDTHWYLKNYPDVAAACMNPLVHFCLHGFRELRNPSGDFDVAWYWLTYLPDDLTTNPLAHYLAAGARNGCERRAVNALTDEDQEKLAATCQRLLKEGSQRSIEFCTRMAVVLKRLSRWSEAEEAYHSALALDWDYAMVHAKLAALLARQGKWWQAVESWSAATNLDSSRASWLFQLGEAQEKMNRFELAAEAYQQAIDREPDHPRWYYLLGYMHERAGNQGFAEAAYQEAIARDAGEDAKSFGIGVFHQARGYWPEAAEAYAREVEVNPTSAELQYKLGMARDRCYRWQEAEQAYRKAIALDPETPYWHYRHGFVLERQERFTEAAEAYAAAAMLSPKPMSYWWYRRGYVLAKAGLYAEACVAYLESRDQQRLAGAEHNRSDHLGPTAAWLDEYLGRRPNEKLPADVLPCDMMDANAHYQVGEARERRGDWAGAAKAYADAAARSNRHRSQWYYRLGFVLFREGRYDAACEAFRETRVFRLPYGVDTSVHAKNPTVFHNMQYREHLDVLPIRPRTVLYESTHGASVGGNPYAIFEYLLDQVEYCDWTHVWVVAPDAVIPSDLRTRANVILVEHDSDLYRRYLATASHVINDSTFPLWFSRRPEQRYLNTWHGTPLKTLGKPIRADEEFLSHRNIQRNLLHATHLISPNQHTSDVLMNDFDVRGIFSGKLAETGYPRVDRTLNATPERIAQVQSRLNLDPRRPVALYAPTWRGIFGHAEVDIERLRSDLNKLAELPCQWVFRGHPFSERALRDAGLPVAIAPPDLDTADVLAVADLLVTDYSSIFFDFLPTRRPIFYYCYDLEEYTSSRGLYFGLNEMPGPLCRDVQSLAAAIERWLVDRRDGDAAYERAMLRFCPHEDGRATARTAAFFLGEDDTHVVTRYRDERPSLLFFGGHFAPNGINASFLNLMHALQESGKYRITVAVEPLRIKKELSWLQKFRQLPEGIAVLGRAGRIVQNAEQAWIANRFQQRREFASPAMRDEFRTAYQDEFHRDFGDARFDALVDFDGYNPYWVMLFGMGGHLPGVCWLHADFFEEFVLKHPYLRTLFAVYQDFARLVSVSERMERVNREKLAQRFHVPEQKFEHCINVIDGPALSELAAAALDPDLLPWFERPATTFLTMGRLSPEKDQAKLVEAFAEVHAAHPGTRLLILGEGPLRLALSQQIKRLGLETSIFLAGIRPNPFPALRRSDCFVLPSNHEGQPMVLLEALSLGKPVIATDIDGNRGVLKDRYGRLVENSVDGLAVGMQDFLEGRFSAEPFDAEEYRAAALSMFEQVVSLR